MNQCKNKILDADGFCGWCGKIHQTRTLGRRTKPVIVLGQEFKPKRAKPSEIISVNKVRWVRSSTDKCPRCLNLLWLKVELDEDNEQIVTASQCRSCNWNS